MTGFGSQTITINELTHYDPTRGLALFRHSESKTEDGSEAQDEKLTSLTPKPNA